MKVSKEVFVGRNHIRELMISGRVKADTFSIHDKRGTEKEWWGEAWPPIKVKMTLEFDDEVLEKKGK